MYDLLPVSHWFYSTPWLKELGMSSTELAGRAAAELWPGLDLGDPATVRISKDGQDMLTTARANLGCKDMGEKNGLSATFLASNCERSTSASRR